MKLPFDPDGEVMGYWVDRWLHQRRLHGATSRELSGDARRLAHAMEPHNGADVVLQEFFMFVIREAYAPGNPAVF